MTEEVEDQLLALSKHILKVHKQLAFDNKYGTKGKVIFFIKCFSVILPIIFFRLISETQNSTYIAIP